MSTVTAAPAFASANEAMDMVQAGLAFLAAADAAAMGSAVQAAMLRGLEEANSVAVAARISVLGAFTAGHGYVDDGAFSPRTWLVHQTAVTRGAAAGHTGWVKRGRAHPRVHAALAAKAVSEPWAKTICKWTGKLPLGSQDAADGILLAAAASGLGLEDLAALAGEMVRAVAAALTRSRRPQYRQHQYRQPRYRRTWHQRLRPVPSPGGTGSRQRPVRGSASPPEFAS